MSICERSSILSSLTISVGVTGHRHIPLELKEKLRQDLSLSFQSVAAATSKISCHYQKRLGIFNENPTLKIVSCLSEGSDRFVGKVGLDEGYRLEAILPFSRRSAYTPLDLKDAALKSSRNELDDLCSHASELIELDRRPPDYWSQLPDTAAGINNPNDISESFRQSAYDEANQEMLSRSDIVFALWNEKPQSSRGSTFAVILQAIEQGIPVVVFPLVADRLPRLITDRKDLFAGPSPEDFDAAVQEAVIHASLLDESSEQKLGNLLDCLDPKVNTIQNKASTWWKRFQKRLSSKEEATVRKTLPTAPWREPANICYKAFDKAATVYAETQRSAFLWVALLSVLAVALSATTVVLPMGSSRSIGVFALNIGQTLSLIGVLWIFFITKRARWKIKLTQTRYVAEVLRLYDFTRNLGLGRYWHGERPNFWVKTNDDKSLDWLLRMVCRKWGTKSVDLADEVQFISARKDIEAYLIESQFVYHTLNALRCSVMNEKISKFSTKVFYLSLFFVASSVVTSLVYAPDWITLTFGFIATLAPVIASSLNAVASRAELSGLAVKSTRMGSELYDSLSIIKNCNDGKSIRAVVAKISELMLSDTEDWKAIYKLENIGL